MRHINEEEFKNVTEKSISMAQAAFQLGIPMSTFIRYAKKIRIYKPNQCGKGIHKISRKRFFTEDILKGNHPQYDTKKIKDRLIKEGYKENKCEICGIKEWQNKIIVFELHHKDGNKFNHSLENFQIICPNCHSQTDNYCSKNSKSYNKIS